MERFRTSQGRALLLDESSGYGELCKPDGSQQEVLGLTGMIPQISRFADYLYGFRTVGAIGIVLGILVGALIYIAATRRMASDRVRLLATSTGFALTVVISVALYWSVVKPD